VKRVEKSGSRGVEEKTTSRGDARVARGSTQRRVENLGHVEIRPEPSSAERAAILIALEQMLNATRRDGVPQPSAWALAGRRESLPGSNGRSRTGWRHGSDWLEGW
jgi:hypothetical protein